MIFRSNQSTGHDSRRSAASRAIRVLIADDNHDSADTLSLLLEYRGCEVHTAYDGEEALIAFAQQPADIVLLDLGMPRMNGHDACRAIRKMKGGAEAVIVALTGWGQERDRQLTQEAGFSEHIVKPIDQESLSALLQRAAEGANNSGDG